MERITEAGAPRGAEDRLTGAGEGLPAPYGGRLVDRMLRGEAAADAAARAHELAMVPLTAAVAADLELLATGAYSPLEGFMDGETYRGVAEGMRLPGGRIFPLPVVLPVDGETHRRLRDGAEVALVGPEGEPLALLRVEDRFVRDLEMEARQVYGTADPAHPGVRQLLDTSPWCLAGPVSLFARRPPAFADHAADPAETRAAFAARGWRRVAAFQTRNPVHRAHEYIQKCAMEVTDGLLLHPLVGPTKDDDVPADVRLASYRELLRLYYPADRVLLAVFPAAMRYAGPREAVFHAICRRNYGCSHLIVGRDHAGVGSHYGPLEAQRLVADLSGELGITPLCFDNAFHCRRCGGMATAKTCPHGAEEHLSLSGTRVRELLRRGEIPPPEFTRPEVARLLAAAMARRAE